MKKPTKNSREKCVCCDDEKDTCEACNCDEDDDED